MPAEWVKVGVRGRVGTLTRPRPLTFLFPKQRAPISLFITRNSILLHSTAVL